MCIDLGDHLQLRSYCGFGTLGPRSGLDLLYQQSPLMDVASSQHKLLPGMISLRVSGKERGQVPPLGADALLLWPVVPRQALGSQFQLWSEAPIPFIHSWESQLTHPPPFPLHLLLPAAFQHACSGTTTTPHSDEASVLAKESPSPTGRRLWCPFLYVSALTQARMRDSSGTTSNNSSTTLY